MGAFGPHGGPLTRAAVSLLSPSERADLREIKAVNDIEGRIVADEFSNPDEHQIQLATELNDIQMLVSENGQEFSTLWLNRNTSGSISDKKRPLLIMSGGFLSSVATVDGMFRAYHMARQFPDHQVLVYDQPGHGYSSPFSKSQREAMSRGDMSDVGWQVYSAIEDYVDTDHVSEVVAKGESFSSRALLDVADASRDQVLEIGKLALFELPGTESNRRFDIHTSYFGFEWLRSSYYGAKIKWWDSHKEDFQHFIEEYSGRPVPNKPDSFFKRDPRMAAANFHNSVLGHGNGQAVLERLVQDDALVVRTTAAKGRVDKLSVAEEMRRDMLARTGQAWGQIALLHESHDGSGFAPRARIAARLAAFSLQHAAEISNLHESYPITMRSIQLGHLLAPEEMSL